MEEGGGSGAHRRLTLGSPGVEKLQRKLDRASALLEPVRANGLPEAAASDRPPAEPTATDGLAILDQTWTVVQLRAEARAVDWLACRTSSRRRWSLRSATLLIFVVNLCSDWRANTRSTRPG